MKKALALILALLMCLSVMVSCGSTSATDQPSAEATTQAAAVTEATTTAVETESPYDANGYLKDNLDPTLNYNGKEVSVFYWSDVPQAEFDVKEMTGDLIKDALYNRNAAVEERLGIKFAWSSTPGNYDNQASYVSHVTNDVNSGGEYDIFAGYSMTAATLAVQGFTRDLMELDHLNLEMPWWPSSLIELTTIKDRLYFCSGDISTNMIHNIYCTFFNKTMASDLKIDDLYTLVREGKWTMDKMAEYGARAYSDLNGDSSVDTNDRFGVAITTNVYFDVFFLGAGLCTVSKDADGNLIMAEEFSSNETQRALEKVVNMFHDNNYAAAPATLSTVSGNIFSDSRTLFLLDVFKKTASSAFTGSDVTYGVIPLPKLDEDQEDYATSMGFPYSLYSVSISLNDEDAQMVGAVLECMASESHRQVTPAVFEITMKLKYASGEDDADMYDLIRNSVYIDIGRVFCTPLKNVPYSVFRNACINGQTTWASRIKAETKPFNTMLTQITQKLDALSNQ